ncbi:Ras suppressor protein 1 [Trichinella spiralis]|uniref:Ras suppressor protein 1 n=1 Tax=Trichinella spiralis TaxID=6334 RepID=UPI0001EFC96E|nr:Ras suppressor protein 1 [Trichinella spiralis]
MVRKETDGKENESEVDLVGKGICNFGEVGHLFVPPSIAELAALEMLWLWNNRIEVKLSQLDVYFSFICFLQLLGTSYVNIFVVEIACFEFRLVLRDNNLIFLPKEIGELSRLKELHIQGNRLTVLPPEIGQLDVVGSKQVLRLDNNPWVAPIADQLQKGEAQIMNYIRSETYK